MSAAGLLYSSDLSSYSTERAGRDPWQRTMKAFADRSPSVGGAGSGAKEHYRARRRRAMWPPLTRPRPEQLAAGPAERKRAPDVGTSERQGRARSPASASWSSIWSRAASRARAWRIGTEHEKFCFTREDLRPLPYDGRAQHPRPARGAGRAVRLGAGARERQCRSRSPSRAATSASSPAASSSSAGAARDPAPDLLRGAHPSRRGEEDRRAAGHRHAGHGLPAEMAARGHPLDAQGPLRDHGRLHAQGRQARRAAT